ncbi:MULTISPECIES: ParA family protein [unclassified Undibacterium]|uniref:ParA family protein n=1 Tax=unclassified Undibacterium TaxID=2630295 RepID=UPI003C2CF296
MSSKPFKVQAVANLLGITVDAVRRDSEEAGIQVARQAGDGPKTRLFTIQNIYELAAFRAKKTLVKPKKKVIMTVYAPKGGVGKTTIASNLSSIFPLLGLKTLVIDLDFQANLSMSFGYDAEMTHEEAIEVNKPVETCVDFHFGNLLPQWQQSTTPSLDSVLKKPYGEFGPHLIPAEVSLDRLEALFTLDAIMSKQPELAIAKFLHEGRSGQNVNLDLSQYDIIIFDAPPAKNQTTRGALLASDFVLAPVSMEKYSTKSVSYLSKVLSEMESSLGKYPELIILGNFFDATRVRVAAQVLALTNQYKNAWLNKTIGSSEEFKKVLSSDDYELPLALAKPSAQSALELRSVAQALIEKMGIL